MTADRHLPWAGCYNARDLGGLKRRNGQETRWGTIVRSDSPARLTAESWAAAAERGFRTVIDLRNSNEIKPYEGPAGFTFRHLPLDDLADTEFWETWGPKSDPLYQTPLYYPLFLDRFPERVANVCTAIARAQDGVILHCAAGRDRTGLISLVLLALADVEPEEIAADHALSTERLKPAWPALGLPDQTDGIAEYIASRDTTAREAILATLDGFDAEKYLRNAGVTSPDIAALRARLT
jgi:protein-tyrosine phosphatase